MDALHGEFTISDGNGGYKTAVMQTGEVTAISSHTSRNVVTLAASGTSNIAVQNPGSTAMAVRELGPRPSRPTYPVV